VQINSDYAILSGFQTHTAPQVSQSTNPSNAIQDAVDALNGSELLGFDRELRFSKDPQSGLGVVDVVNLSSGEVILQIPSQTALRLAQILQNGN
jgi:uncharacterized FlaG/YvyC family protein